MLNKTTNHSKAVDYAKKQRIVEGINLTAQEIIQEVLENDF